MVCSRPRCNWSDRLKDETKMSDGPEEPEERLYNASKNKNQQ